MKLLTVLPLFLIWIIRSSAFEDDSGGTNTEFPEDKCFYDFSKDCLKLDAIETIIDKLSHKRSIKLLPGLILETGGYESGLVGNKTGPESFDKFISTQIQQFFSSIHLKIKVIDKDTVEKITRLTSDLSSADSRGFSPRIRKPNNINTTALLGALISAATMLAMALSALAAMAGKALAMSTVSLGLAMMDRNNHHGWNNGQGQQGKAVEVHHTHSTSINSMPTTTHHAPMPPATHEPYKPSMNYFK